VCRAPGVPGAGCAGRNGGTEGRSVRVAFGPAAALEPGGSAGVAEWPRFSIVAFGVALAVPKRGCGFDGR
jgi:hypothetical protein